MRRSLRSLISLSLLLVLLAPGLTPTALAQDSPAPGAPCVDSGLILDDEALPADVVREMVIETAVDSSGFATTTAPAVPSLTAVSSVVCIAANTEVEVEVEGAPSTVNISQFYTTSIVVLSGELELRLVEECANPRPTGIPPCTPSNGVATFRTGGDRTTPVALALGDWTPIAPGSIVVLSDVTISMRTGDTVTRMLTSGVLADSVPGGACPTGCGRWRPP